MLHFLSPALVVFGALTGWSLIGPLGDSGAAPWPVTVCWTFVLPVCGTWAGAALARTLRNPGVLDRRAPRPFAAAGLGTVAALLAAAACGWTLIDYDTWFGSLLARHTEHDLHVQLLTLSLWPLAISLALLLPWPPPRTRTHQCPGCGYSLAQLTERAGGRCPECGREFRHLQHDGPGRDRPLAPASVAADR